ncbi:MAG: acetyl-CoA carboxylase biotin carboxyl carrier protein [Candidatus Neomarinimicrobiota bacterium]|nr:acetyl-CoA carboxylase biotin carboxyl carrier protein [Candidatus Neomarinimicrobiota bacterium]
MWKDKLKEVIYILENSNINEIEVRFWFGKIKVTKDAPTINADPESLSNETIAKIEKPTSDEVVETQETATPISSDSFTVRSPMPGTFYSSPDPDSKPFVEIGTKVKEGDTLCIIEAMKIMNEIQSEKSGIIKEIITEDGSAIEFDQPLFVIDSSE